MFVQGKDVNCICTQRVKTTRVAASVPSKKILLWGNVCFVAHKAHASAQSCRHTNSETYPTLKGLCDVYIYTRGATNSSFRGAIFMKFHSMMSSFLFNCRTTFSQTDTDEVLFATLPKMRTSVLIKMQTEQSRQSKHQ